MKLLLLTSANEKIATARSYFFQMQQLLKEKKIDVSLNKFNHQSFDIIIILWSNMSLIEQAIKHSPGAKIGILNAIDLKFDSFDKYNGDQDFLNNLLANVDFFLTYSIVWEGSFILKYRKRVYRVLTI